MDEKNEFLTLFLLQIIHTKLVLIKITKYIITTEHTETSFVIRTQFRRQTCSSALLAEEK